MLEELTIRNLGVIREARVPLGPGLTCISGETGAGKTLILGSLGLLMGKRADAGLVRPGEDQAMIDGVWALSEDSPHKKVIEDTGAELEDGQAFISRSLKSDGKSRASLCGRSVPAKTLGEVTANLVNIHGQSDQLRLRTPDAQREALDRFGGKGLAAALAAYLVPYREARKIEARLADLKKNRAAREREYLQLSSFLEEFDALDPQENELDDLAAQIALLSSVDSIREGVSTSLQILSPESDDAEPPLDALESLHRSLVKLSNLDETLQAMTSKLEAGLDLLADLQDELETYAHSLDGDKIQELYAAQEREVSLKAFLKKHRYKLDEALQAADDAVKRLKELDPEANDATNLQDRLDDLNEDVASKAKKVSDLRSKAARKLESSVNAELAGLAMGGVKLVVGMSAVKPGPNGGEEVALEILQPGATKPQPITKAASGGELSRIMLALEVVLADPTATPTFIFDEVDSGVGGATAIEIGRRLATLSREAQVIVITHLAQVACFSDSHLLVKKTVKDGSAETTVKLLSEDQRRREITRLLSGLEESGSGQAHADELLALGAAHRKA